MDKVEKEEGISLGEIIHAILKNIWYVVIITIGVIILGAIYTFAIAKEKYSASSTIVVAITTDEAGESLDYSNSSRLIYTIADLIKQDVILDDVAQQYNKNVVDFAKNVTVESNSNSFLLTITVVDESKTEVVDIVNSIVNKLIDEVNTNQALAFAKGTITPTSLAKEGVYDSPNKILYLLVSAVLGVVFSLVVILIKELASNKYKSKKDVENSLEEKIIGSFYDDGIKRKDEKNGHKEIKLVTPSIRTFEPYNKLFSNIRYSNLENPYKVIMTSSTSMNELKSTICANLAYCIATNDKKVVIIDLDVRKPVLYKTFKVERENGLVEYIEGTIDKSTLIKHSKSGVDVITSGKKIINPMVILESKKLKDLITELRAEYDYILIDTPPVNICSDGLVISKLCDGIIFNIAMYTAKKSDINEALASLKNIQANIIGLNLTKLEISKKESSYYNSYEE